MLKKHKTKIFKIGIVGCGAIGSSLAQAVVKDFKRVAQLVGLFDIQLEKAQRLSQKLVGNKRLVLRSLEDLIKRVDLVIEASSAKAAWEIARKSLICGRQVMVMSVGGLADHLEELVILTAKYNARIYFPSGAISGIDALKAANMGTVSKVILTTRKHPNAFKGVDYVMKKFNLANIKKDKVLFSGSAALAVKYFPQNVNVAAVLGLAGIGMQKTQVKIIASPSVKKNIHEVIIESEAAKIFTRTENILHPENPKTSFLAVLSAMATLKQILQPIKIGT